MSTTRLPDGWRAAKLSDLGEVGRGRSRHRPRHAPHLYGGPYPFIQTGEVKASGGRITSFSQTYSEDGLEQSRLWPAGTMCITIAANIAETGILDFAACFPDSVVGFIPDEEKCDVYFIEYTFRHLKRLIQHRASGTVQDNINLGTLDRLTLPLPPLPEQRAIARILGALDDKVELNREMNRTLEATAQTLFKSWFVDFDPVVAKADGRKPFGMSEEIAELFPDRFVKSELGPIPEGWVWCSVEEAFEVTPRRALEKGEVAPYLAMADAPTESAIPWSWGSRKYGSGVRFKQGDTLMAKITPCLENGKSAYVGFLREDEVGWGSTEFIVLAPKGTMPQAFPYFLTRLDEFRAYAIANMTGSSGRQRVPISALKHFEIALPSDAIYRAFGAITAPIMSKLVHNVKEAQTLAKLRDLLLPKLLSGEIRVGEAEAAVEAAGS